ncbi:MAG TPA: efflux RND transporter periplasmic adaptor subunit [Dokdonella sp.]|uniref:efflux RND transporter periplasmic adaptor subunit n=1 Tax=Dokdonella sp. TaxID=2291710 RepID=UPI002D7F5A41|nr:efflux RND transporter periplasmic adaptor subunit [Dokdonella sp.]HET9032205.1 efflux RND transporter periplasmic adaptor subunit [Dokdonella sp.]
MTFTRSLLLAIGSIGLLAGCGHSTPEDTLPTAAPTFATAVASAEDGRSEQVWDGVVEAVNQATISAQTSGRVIELPYDVNDTVAEGAVIVRFTDVEQKSAKSRAQSQIASAQAAYDEAEASYQRISEVYARKLVARAQLDQERARRDAARAALNAARAQFSEVGQQMDYTVVRAPYAGIVTERFVQIGESVRPGQALIAGVSLKDLRVSVQVPQSAIAPIRALQAADVLLPGDGSRRVAASKVTVFPYADPATHTFTVRLELPGDNTGLFPGMTVKAAFATGEAKRLLVPLTALVARGELQGIYVVDGSHVRLRQIRSGHRFGDSVEILAGLVAGERYATDPAAAAQWLARRNDGGSQ